MYLAACAPGDTSIACIKEDLERISRDNAPDSYDGGTGGAGDFAGSVGILLMYALVIALIAAVFWWRRRVRQQRAAQEQAHLAALHREHYAEADDLLMAPPPAAGYPPQYPGQQQQQPGTYDVWATPPESQGGGPQ